MHSLPTFYRLLYGKNLQKYIKTGLYLFLRGLFLVIRVLLRYIIIYRNDLLVDRSSELGQLARDQSPT